MFTTGSKFLIGGAVVATISAIAYGIAQDGVMGTIGLASAAVALAFLAGVNIFTRDSNVWEDEISLLIPSLGGVTYAELDEYGLCWPAPAPVTA